MSTDLRDLPSVDRLLGEESIQALVKTLSREVVTALVRERLECARADALAGIEIPEAGELAEDVQASALAWKRWPSAVINATGVVLHTNLGRAPLSAAAAAAAGDVAVNYSDLEFDLESGKRGSRQAMPAELLRRVTGAEAAMVVNNNASAVLLGLSALAPGMQVLVSRGEAVEIGGGFRIPDVLSASGAELVEVGSTNRTYVADYEGAITEETGAILIVHTSNFRTVGFTHAPSLGDLVELGARHGIPVLHDLGSGCLVDTSRYGLAHEPMPQESLAAGVDLAFFSGDKVLGGPQAGLIVGKREPVARLQKHPMARAVRADKMCLAALGTTLLHYLMDEAESQIPVLAMISAAESGIRERAERWAEQVGAGAVVVGTRSAIGGGSLPGETLPSWAVSIDPGDAGADALTARLRSLDPPVVVRIEDGRLLLDPRTVLPAYDEYLVEAIKTAIAVE